MTTAVPANPWSTTPDPLPERAEPTVESRMRRDGEGPPEAARLSLNGSLARTFPVRILTRLYCEC